ncbi:MAG: MlaC/ttg2D family ABC transporter substrate-binding protein [Henriciella sp.]
MMKFPITFIALALAIIVQPTASADAITEAYVQENANDVLNSLNNPELSPAERRLAFQEYMDQFANINAVARFVVGKYSRRFSDQEMLEYQDAFRDYALTVYENYFDEYKGQSVFVSGSTDRNARDSIVDTTILSSDGREMYVRWRVLKRGDKYQVVDVALNTDGNVIWLAIEQQAQFLSILDRSNGSAQDLVAKIRDMTADIRDS